MKFKNILLGQLAARGDCLYATTVARQIKADYPNCRLTWAIGSMCRDIIENNPYVDEIWEVPLSNHAAVTDAWNQFEKEALARKKAGVFDEVFFTQINPNNFQNFDGTVRASIFRGYHKPMQVPVPPVIRLSEKELAHVRDFALQYRLRDFAHVILFECASNSGQSFVTQAFAIEVSKALVNKFENVCVILSSNIPIASSHDRIIDGSVLTFKENAELTHYCSLLIGCSSGISWLCTADWSKELPKIQLLKRKTSVFASMTHDFEHFGLRTDLVSEMTECSSQKLFECVASFVDDGFVQARNKFHETVPLKFDFYWELMLAVASKRQHKKVLVSAYNTIKRYGWRFSFFKTLAARLLLGLRYAITDNINLSFLRKLKWKK
jgi:hypothetical protein